MAQPNILYIMSDQHAARCVGMAGDRAALTPNIDRLMKEGARFENAYCPSPVCLPSRMSMLTGQYPFEQECWTNNDMLASDRPTWLHALGASGYHTVLVGRMHALGPDQLHGFAERYIGDHSPNWPGVNRKSLGQLAGASGPNPESLEKSGIGSTSYDQLDEDVTVEAIYRLSQLASSSGNKPFCLAVGFMLPHPPYVSRKEDYEAVAPLVDEPDNDKPGSHSWLQRWRDSKNLSAFDKSDVMRARIGYYGMIRRLDINIGRLLTALDNHGLTDSTIIVYLSDHGDHIGEHGLFWKHTFYDVSAKVPLALRFPEKIDAGKQISQPVSLGALGPTLLELVGVQSLPNASMKSFASLVHGGQTETRPVFIEYCTDGSSAWEMGFSVQQRAVIFRGYKYAIYNGYPDQMFDLENDPGEVTNLAQSPEYRDRALCLRDMILKDWDPEKIALRLQARKKDKDLLRKWAAEVEPVDILRWNLKPEQNLLERHLSSEKAKNT